MKDSGDIPEHALPSGARDMNVPVFVFGSNLAGRHGKGAALWAREHRGAVYGCGVGYRGNSYAIPTKDEHLRPLPLPEIAEHVEAFVWFASIRTDLAFQLTPVGCGLAGFRPEQIAPMFSAAPANVVLPEEFRALLGNADSAGNACEAAPDARDEEFRDELKDLPTGRGEVEKASVAESAGEGLRPFASDRACQSEGRG